MLLLIFLLEMELGVLYKDGVLKKKKKLFIGLWVNILILKL